MRMDGSRGAATRPPGLGANGNDAITTYVPSKNRTALRFFLIVKERTADSRGVTAARAFAPRTRDSSMGAGGADRIRTDDPLLAKQMLSQLSYSPEARIPPLFSLPVRRFTIVVGLVGVEPTTPALSRRCSNQLSYRPVWTFASVVRCQLG